MSAPTRHVRCASRSLSDRPKIGILAGSGPLPAKLVEACRAAGRDVFVVAFNGETAPETVEDVPHAWVNVTAVGKTLKILRDHDVEELVMIGPVGRPDFSGIRPDWHGAKLLPKVIKAARRGDDAIMKVLVDDLEHQGFKVVGAEAVLANLAAPSGVMGREEPSDADKADIARAIEVLDAIGRLDIGQAVVVREGYVLAVEAAEGTDAMLDRCVAFREAQPAGVLVKLPKPNQERRADLPTIGPTTVKRAAAAGLRGIAFEAGGALIDDREAVIRAADDCGLFVVGIDPGASR